MVNLITPVTFDVKDVVLRVSFFLYIIVYGELGSKPVIVIVPSLPLQVVGFVEVALILGIGLVVTSIVALGPSQPNAVFLLT